MYSNAFFILIDLRLFKIVKTAIALNMNRKSDSDDPTNGTNDPFSSWHFTTCLVIFDACTLDKSSWSINRDNKPTYVNFVQVFSHSKIYRNSHLIAQIINISKECSGSLLCSIMPTAPKNSIDEAETILPLQTPKVFEKPCRRRPASVAMVKRPEPPTSSIISTKQISILRARVQARLAEQSKKLIINIPESDKQISLKTKIPMPPIKSSQSLHAFTAPVPPSTTRRTQSFRQHSSVSTVSVNQV